MFQGHLCHLEFIETDLNNRANAYNSCFWISTAFLSSKLKNVISFGAKIDGKIAHYTYN